MQASSLGTVGRSGRGDVVTEWVVVPDGRLWRVAEEREGRVIEYSRRHLSGLACITAQVLAAELNRAWQLGRGVFDESLGD